MSYFSLNKLRNIIRGHKTLSQFLITKMSSIRFHARIVTLLIEQTSKQLKTRIAEHTHTHRERERERNH